MKRRRKNPLSPAAKARLKKIGVATWRGTRAVGRAAGRTAYHTGRIAGKSAAAAARAAAAETKGLICRPREKNPKRIFRGYAVQIRGKRSSVWKTVTEYHAKAQAEKSARSWAKMNPYIYVRVLHKAAW